MLGWGYSAIYSPQLRYNYHLLKVTTNASFKGKNKFSSIISQFEITLIYDLVRSPVTYYAAHTNSTNYSAVTPLMHAGFMISQSELYMSSD